MNFLSFTDKYVSLVSTNYDFEFKKVKNAHEGNSTYRLYFPSDFVILEFKT
jgi:hypothetical protein